MGLCLDLCVIFWGVGWGGTLLLKYFYFFLVGVVFFQILGRQFFFKFLFQFFLFLFSVLWWKFITFCSTFTHSFTQTFSCFGGNCKCWKVCFFVLGKDKQLNNCFWKILVALRRAGWCDLCRLICSFGPTLLAGLAGRS